MSSLTPVSSSVPSGLPCAPAVSTMNVPVPGGGAVTFNFNIQNAPQGAPTGVTGAASAVGSAGGASSPLQGGASADSFTSSTASGSQPASGASAGVSSSGAGGVIAPPPPPSSANTGTVSTSSSSSVAPATDAASHMIAWYNSLKQKKEATDELGLKYDQLHTNYQDEYAQYLQALKQVDASAYQQALAEAGGVLPGVAPTPAPTLPQDPYQQVLAQPQATPGVSPQGIAPSGLPQMPANALNPFNAANASALPATFPANGVIAPPPPPVMAASNGMPNPALPGAPSAPPVTMHGAPQTDLLTSTLGTLGITPEQLQQLPPEQLSAIASSPQVQQALQQTLAGLPPERQQAVLQAAQSMLPPTA